MKTNALKKGDRVQLRNGWFATIADNLKGNTRMATVEGICTETGSVYSHDIVRYYPPYDHLTEGDEVPSIIIQHTPAQLACKARDEAFA